MFYIKNVPWRERLARIGLSIAIAFYGLTRTDGALSWLLVAGAVGLVLTGVLGFCPACALIGRRLKK